MNIIKMENRHQKVKGRSQNEYIKRLQKIVYEKERELEYINSNIQLEETKADFERTIEKLEATISSQKKQLKEKDLQLFRLLDTRQNMEFKRPPSSAKRPEHMPTTYRSSEMRNEHPVSAPSDSQLLRELTQNRQKFEQAKQDISRLALQIEVVKGDLEAEEGKNDQLTQQVGRLQEDNSRLIEQLEDAQAQISKLRQAQTEFQMEVSMGRQDREKMVKELAELRRKLHQQDAQQNYQSSNSTLKGKVQKLEDEIVSLQNIIEQEKLLRVFAESNIQQLKANNTREIQEIAAAHHKRTMELQGLKSTTIQNLENNISVLTSKLTQNQTNASLLAHELELLTMRYNVLENKYIILQTEKITHQVQINEQNLKHQKEDKTKAVQSKQQSEIDDVSNSTFLKASEQAEIVSLKMEINHLQDQIEFLKIELLKKDIKIQNMEMGIKELKKEEKQLRQKQRKASEAEMRSMEAERSTYQQGVLFRQQIDSLKSQNETLIMAINQSQRNLQILNNQLSESKQKHTILSSSQKSKLEQIQKLKNSLQQSKKATINLMNEKDDMTKELQQLRREKRKNQTQTNNFRECCKRQNWYSDLISHLPSVKMETDRAQSPYEIKCVLLDSICQWISSCLLMQADLKGIAELLKTITDKRLTSMEHLADLIDHLLKPTLAKSSLLPSTSKLHSNNELPLTTQLAAQISHLLKDQTIQVDSSSFEVDKEHNQQLFLDNLQKQIQLTPDDGKVHQGAASEDVSQMRENFKMVKAVNEQLFVEITGKQKHIQQLSTKLKQLQQFSLKQEHLKFNIRNLMKEVKQNDRVSGYLTNICSLLELNR